MNNLFDYGPPHYKPEHEFRWLMLIVIVSFLIGILIAKLS